MSANIATRTVAYSYSSSQHVHEELGKRKTTVEFELNNEVLHSCTVKFDTNNSSTSVGKFHDFTIHDKWRNRSQCSSHKLAVKIHTLFGYLDFKISCKP